MNVVIACDDFGIRVQVRALFYVRDQYQCAGFDEKKQCDLISVDLNLFSSLLLLE